MHWHQVLSRHVLISVRQTQGQVLMGPEAQVPESTIGLQVVPCVPHTQGPAGGFLIDIHAMLERVSLIFQRDDLSVGDVGAEVNTAIEETAKLPTACGKLESQVLV